MGKCHRGFSMIELMVVLVILGLIAGLVGPRLFGRADVAKVQTAQTQIQMIKSGVSLFYLDVGRFPTNEEGLAVLIRNSSNHQFWRGPYLDGEVPVDPWNNPYRYEAVRSGISEFSLYSYGADGVSGGDGLNSDLGYLPDAE